ncbi:unnamed protein product [Heterosigma akashiwo]
MSGKERAPFMRRVAEIIGRKKEELAQLETLDSGKPLSESKWDVDAVVSCFQHFAALAEVLDSQQGETVDVGDSSYVCSLEHQAVGVVGAIIPWNYPLLMASWKLAPALAAGCTVVLKPSELAPLTCQELGHILQEAGVPAGVVNIVTGLGAEAGAALATHPGVDKITFTGSNSTGQRIMEAAAAGPKNISLELGGKSAAVVFSSCDLAQAVEWVAFGCFSNNGQVCSATSRLLLEEEGAFADEFLARLRAQCAALEARAGDPRDPACRLGPLIGAPQVAAVQGFVDRAVAAGAELLCGGGAAARRPPPRR